MHSRVAVELEANASRLELVAHHLGVNPGQERGDPSVEAGQAWPGTTNAGTDDSNELVSARVRVVLNDHGAARVALQMQWERVLPGSLSGLGSN